MSRWKWTDIYNLVAVNLLNVADFALTQHIIDGGYGAEFNPVMRWLGIPAKLIIVPVASIGLFILAPKWLKYIEAAFIAVITYTALGLAYS